MVKNEKWNVWWIDSLEDELLVGSRKVKNEMFFYN